jgi:hypothetical protein
MWRRVFAPKKGPRTNGRVPGGLGGGQGDEVQELWTGSSTVSVSKQLINITLLINNFHMLSEKLLTLREACRGFGGSS